MKTTLLRLLPLFAFLAVAVHAADDKLIAAVRAADDARLAATIAADKTALEAIYSDDLHYVHSSGKVDNKASQVRGITTSGSAYESFDHKERTFVPAGPGVVLMYGHVLVNMKNKASGAKNTNDIQYLAVWREEKGKWRFLAWQASKVVQPDAKK
ncbi:MAG TPA: nuclear transport factor 2 family protein [Opitutaceae bacterium]|nr:nuclear transport factor 2 family protein [Opitutaceae bacterium]